MEIYVACDICGHRYVLPEERSGRNAKCKSCGVSFDVGPENYYDPDTSELDEPAKSDDDGSSTMSIWQIASKIGHGLAGLVTAGILVWMVSLVFRSPREAAAYIPGNMATRRNQSSSNPNLTPRFNPGQPQVGRRPAQAPFVPPQAPFSPPKFPSPIRGIPEPPVIDGSMGWPKSEPDTRPPIPRPITRPEIRPNRRLEKSDLVVGQTIEVQRDGEWLSAIVRQIEANGMIRVHYRGRSQGDDESVSRDRIRTK